ncbi:radical SAM protein [Streptomyces sp. AM2-3-1]|uniref:B12-binding domain-containing radical SAM protein n=1 Tax=Streptomyces sp. AM2-3-1 TaxID=3075824 RepID=UPI0028C407DB|nr:radical SAM protein [Streptomyces sp. AM2-3-1]WNO67448.1 radical SAM protein [Streptomyces sp. AM2-3-1]
MADTTEPVVDGRVAIIFPPLVETSFGSLYPAPAVLAGYLAAKGIATSQLDLNEAFAEFLLSPVMLATIGAGEVPGVPVDSLCAAAARLCVRYRDRMIDAEGRHHFGADSDFGYLLEILAQPFSLDPDGGVLGPLRTGSGLARTYLDFYEWSETAELVEEGTLLVGISVPMGPQLFPALVLAAYLKSVQPQLKCVLGGPALSLMDDGDLEHLLRSHTAVDCAVRFDGEQPLLSLAEQLRSGEWRPEDLPGVSCLRQGEITHVAPGPGPNLNMLPHPKYSKSALGRLANPTMSITQARGCYWGKCDYCDFVELYDGSPSFRGRHPGNFVDEIGFLVAEFGIQRFNFVTESIPPAFARRMSMMLLQRDLKITWNSFAMVDRRFDRELLSLMVEAGCEYLVIGMETMVSRVLKLVHKSADRDENIRFLRDARDVGMKLQVNLIPDLPSTTYEEAMSTLTDMEGLSDCVDGISVFPFEATRSSNVGRNPQDFGLIPVGSSGAPGQSQYALNHFDNHDPAMTPEQRKEVHQRYRDYANRVNAKMSVAAVVDAGNIRKESRIRIVEEELDVLDTGEKLVCTHMGTRERITIPTAFSRVLEPYLGGSWFTLPDLETQLGEERTGVLIRNLVASRMLIVSGSAPDRDVRHG